MIASRVQVVFVAVLGGVEIAFATMEARRAALARALVDGAGPAASLDLAALDRWYGTLAPLGLAAALALAGLAWLGVRRLRARSMGARAALGLGAFAVLGSAVGLWLGGPSQTPSELVLGAALASLAGGVGACAAVMLGVRARSVT